MAKTASAAVGVAGLAALIVLVWLVAGLLEEVDVLGTALLIALAVVLGGFAVLAARIARTPEPGSSRVHRDPRR